MDSSDDEQLELDQQNSSFQEFQHLNIDLCLELIFPYLDVSDFGNVADSCKQMKRAAEIVFAHKYGRNVFLHERRRKWISAYSVLTHRNLIYIHDPKMCYQVLRSFGHLISKLHLECYESNDLFLTHLDEYVTKYCANYITELEFTDRKRSFENFQMLKKFFYVIVN